MFNPATSSKKIKEEFIDYIATTFSFANQKYNQLLINELNYGFEDKKGISKGPIVDIKDVFESHPQDTIESLIRTGILSAKFFDIEREKLSKDLSHYKIRLPINQRALYKHQKKAIQILVNDKKNAVITTGTGSGKTECFLIPIINELLREIENGTLSSGVRAILIYPMNALANDQMKRLREILMFYPKIKFGLLNGDTKYSQKEAEAVYKSLHVAEEIKELRSPLKNEYISREKMWDTPPNILCTNYAMLEHLLLRPESDTLFKNSDFKYIILDEAHVYSGATGMETALLLRRLMARINYSTKPQFVLTSATLGQEGKSEQEIVRFANSLTGEQFDKSCIVYGNRVSEDFSQTLCVDYPLSLFEKLADCSSDAEMIAILKESNLYDDNQPLEKNLYSLCKSSALYKKLRTINSKDSLIDIKSFSTHLGISEDALIKFIAVCTKCFADGKALVDARYHFFIRTLEGLYASFYKETKFYLERKTIIGLGENAHNVFEVSVCRNCGEIAIVGTPTKDGRLTKVSQVKQFEEKGKPIRFYHISEAKINDDEFEDDEFEDDELEEFDDEQEEFEVSIKGKKKIIEHLLCVKCGAISEEEDGEPKCDCGKENIIKVREYINAGAKCSKCQSGNYSRFYLGNEASTSVVATSLFEDLPTKIIKEKIDGVEYEREGGKQFLAFSDSRSEAAFFASYLGKSYSELLRRRGVIHVISKFREEIIENPWNLEELVEEVAKFFRQREVFKSKLMANLNQRELRKASIKNAWIAVLVELVNARRKTSLTSLGVLKFEYAGNTPRIVEAIAGKYGLDKNVCKALLDELAMSFAYFGAIDSGDSDELDFDDKKYIYFTSKQKAVCELKDNDSSRYFMSWKARNREGKDKNSFYKNVRQKLVMDAIGCDGQKANDFLEFYFREVLIKADNRDYRAVKGSGNFYFMPAKNFIVRVNGDETVKWYRCTNCKKITSTNITGNCNVYNCDGKLVEVDSSQLFKENHYLGLYYRKLLPLLLSKSIQHSLVERRDLNISRILKKIESMPYHVLQPLKWASMSVS